MSTKEREFLRSEVTTLEGLLGNLPEDRIIERIGFEERSRQAQERLAVLEASPLAKALPITFRGAPVEGTRSIAAGFAAAALRAFIEATDTVAASLTSEGLKGRGRLPSASRSLRIIDTAQGSFGFELELPPPVTDPAQIPPPIPGEAQDPYAQAIERTFELIKDAASSDDVGMSDLIAEIHPRAAAKVRAFAKVLSDHDAGFAAEFDGKSVHLNRGIEVEHVLDALKDEDIAERTEEHSGVLMGILPESRRFECRLDEGQLITGRVDRDLENLGAFEANWENKKARLTFRVVSVRTNQRFILVDAARPEGSIES
ncbi:hypothetical protein [Thiocapsa marina]|uniref:Uncharacterized protein n=1 Tax=Thiocapsa marina 5811 TaxID=768671 RepID=F9U8T9_9GAMM|nr:hypothetical protein [Thiocapsa marina]EGV19197.1 hypothetical protein ThimaDRAFT_1341 [Thiocapsa marina 5811]